MCHNWDKCFVPNLLISSAINILARFNFRHATNLRGISIVFFANLRIFWRMTWLFSYKILTFKLSYLDTYRIMSAIFLLLSLSSTPNCQHLPNAKLSSHLNLCITSVTSSGLKILWDILQYKDCPLYLMQYIYMVIHEVKRV